MQAVGGKELNKKGLASSYFPTIKTAVSSAKKSLTSEFGMGSGIPSSLWTLNQIWMLDICEQKYIIDRKRRKVFEKQDERTISTGQLNISLCLHLRPINDVVCIGPSGKTYLKAGFPLRCFQRLSLPHIATLLCRWHDNRSTRGASIPVLSY